MPILNSVSTKIRRGDQEDAGGDSTIKKIYRGDKLVYENAHLPITGNAVEHPWFEGDKKYNNPHGRSAAQEEWNGWHSETGNPLNYTDGWGKYSPLFTNVFDYKSYDGKYFLYRYRTPGAGSYFLSGHSDDEHVDLASAASTWNLFPVGGEELSGAGVGAQVQQRILLLHGAGDNFDPVNKDPDRSYATPPITSCTTEDYGDVGTEDFDSPSSLRDKRWALHQYMCQVTVPDDAKSMTFGAYVRIPKNDMLDDKNMGCITAILPAYNASDECFNRVNTIIFRKAADASSTILREGSVSGVVSGKSTFSQGHYQWSGPTLDTGSDGFGTRGINRWNDFADISDHKYEDAEDYHEFKKVSRTIYGEDLRSGNTSRLAILSLGFLENHSNLPDSRTGTPSGAVHFYNVFATFDTSTPSLVSENLVIHIDAENAASYSLSVVSVDVTGATNANYNGTYEYDSTNDVWYNNTNTDLSTDNKGYFYFNDSASRWQFGALQQYAKATGDTALNSFLSPSPDEATGFWSIDTNSNWTAGNSFVTAHAQAMSFAETLGGTTITDLQGNHNATLSGSFNDSPSPKNWEIDKDAGASVEFITFGDIETFNAPKDFTFSIWFEFTSISGDHDIFSKGIHATDKPILCWYDATVSGDTSLVDEGAGNTATISFLVYDGDTMHWVSAPSSSIVANQKYNLVIQHSTTGRSRIYINGVKKADHTKSSVDGMGNSVDPLKIGAPKGAGTQDSDMKIYAFHAYDKFLSYEEISQNFNHLRGRFSI